MQARHATRILAVASVATLAIAWGTLVWGSAVLLQNLPDFDGNRSAEERYAAWAAEPLRWWGAGAALSATAAVVMTAVGTRASRRRVALAAGAVAASVAALGLVATGVRGYSFRNDPPTTRSDLAALEVPQELRLERPPGTYLGSATARWRGRGHLAAACRELTAKFNQWVTGGPATPLGLPGRCELRGDRFGAAAWAELVAAGVAYSDGRPTRPLGHDEELVLEAELSVGPRRTVTRHPASNP